MKHLLSIIALALCCAVAAVTVDQYSPIPGAEFSTTAGGALKKCEVLSDVSGGTVKLERVLSLNVYTNAVEILTSTQTTFTVVFSNSVAHTVFTNIYPTTQGLHPPLNCVVIASNIVEDISATTNTWPVFKEVYSQTETIFSGSLTGHSYSNAPENVFLMLGDKLIFSGEASTNGWLRLILE